MLKKLRTPDKVYINSIEEDRKIDGEWWLPSHPDDKVMGTLHLYQERGIRLHLLSMFKQDEEQPELASHEFINGTIIPDGLRVAIIKASEFERTLSTKPAQKFEADKVSFGFHIPDKESFTFNKYEFSTTYLIDWLHPNLIKTSNNQKKLEAQPDQVITIPFEEYTINFVSRCKYMFGADYSESLAQFSWVSVEAVKPIPYELFETKFLKPIFNFVRFATNYFNSITFIQGFKDGKDNVVKVASTTGFPRVKHSESMIRHNMLFGFFDITEEASSILKKWLKFNESNGHIIDLYFDSFQVDKEFPISKFLIVEQAIESFHMALEKLYGQKDSESKDLFLTNIAKINTSLNEDLELKRWVKSTFLYRPELRVRLDDLITNCSDIIIPIIHNKDIFIRRVVKTRNYYTHYNPDYKGKQATGIELELMTHSLRIILVYHILIELGMATEVASKLVTESNYYNNLQQSQGLVWFDNDWVPRAALLITLEDETGSSSGVTMLQDSWANLPRPSRNSFQVPQSRAQMKPVLRSWIKSIRGAMRR